MRVLGMMRVLRMVAVAMVIVIVVVMMVVMRCQDHVHGQYGSSWC